MAQPSRRPLATARRRTLMTFSRRHIDLQRVTSCLCPGGCREERPGA
ncbi:putative leader peptide [Frankia sp. QA3]|nr:putative leader peptide [Frankia sp. QA3]EIV92016.1 hypothetical protein FraQA3DRAFT_1505 [Frankia sp. QA3]